MRRSVWVVYYYYYLKKHISIIHYCGQLCLLLKWNIFLIVFKCRQRRQEPSSGVHGGETRMRFIKRTFLKMHYKPCPVIFYTKYFLYLNFHIFPFFLNSERFCYTPNNFKIGLLFFLNLIYVKTPLSLSWKRITVLRS